MTAIYQTRIVIETKTPMAIYSGNRDIGFDNQLARDANGLPYIPATSIAGVWRTLVREGLGETVDKAWFGYTDNKGTNEHSSRLSISNGIIHDSKNQPVVGLKSQAEIKKDPLLALMHQDKPMHRERVQINDRGVATDKAKFDQLLIPAGVRFCIDITFDNSKLSENEITQWQGILNCWQHRRFALGATTRNGLGQFNIVGLLEENADLKQHTQAAKRLSSFAKREEIPTSVSLPNNSHAQPFAILPLKALDNWRCGSGSQLLGTYTPDKSLSMLSYSEYRIVWDKNKAHLNSSPTPVLCGSSIKGILAHRIAYHLRRHEGIWAEDMADCNHEQWQTRPEVLKDLLGMADDEHENSLAGKLYVDDSDIHFEQTIIRHHNSIDRFTGGVRQGALYSEELLYQPEFTLTLWLAPNTVLKPELKAAITDTLNDLKMGLLPMGAGSGRGTSLVQHNHVKEWLVDLEQITEQVTEKVSLEKTNSVVESSHE
jgi:CRISPR/Cas system CMR subunit Cmr4 (Cas7 group RAMP superfamily)